MRRVIMVNTYYQLIFAVQLKTTLFKDDEIVLLVSDHSAHADLVTENIKKLHFFEEVYYISTLGTGDNRTNIQKIKDFLQITFGKRNRYYSYIKEIKNLCFDEILVFNYNISTYGLYALLAQHNRQIKVSRFEEGVLSYNTGVIQTKRRRLIDRLRKIQGKSSITSALDHFYCFYPELYLGELDAVAVPQIKRQKELVDTLQTAFALDRTTLSYKERYIFFTSVYDFEGGDPIGEYDLVCRIAEIVGKEDLLVKVHPRDRRTLYVDNGFKVDGNSFVPWEVIQLSLDIRDKVFITAISGSVLAGSLMLEDMVETYYMYRCCDLSGNVSAIEAVRNIEALLGEQTMRESFRMVKVARRLEDICK